MKQDGRSVRIADEMAHRSKESLVEQSFVRGIDYSDDEKDALREEVKALRKELREAREERAELWRKNAALHQALEQIARELEG